MNCEHHQRLRAIIDRWRWWRTLNCVLGGLLCYLLLFLF